MSKVFDRNQITALILAGGRGSRLNDEDKGLTLWQGKPLVQHVCERLAPQVESLLISCNRNSDEYGYFCDRTLGDSRSGYCGPLAGLEAAQSHINTDLVAVVSCDTPLVPENLVEGLFQPFAMSDNSPPVLSYAQDGDRSHYLCALMLARTLASITPYLDQGRRSVRGWYETLDTVAVDFSDQAHAFKNFNIREDFAEE
jgi:molybdenum cofactor guanylyltransferase